MKEKLHNIKTRAERDVLEVVDSSRLKDVQVKYLGKKGEITQVLRSMGSLSKEERPIMGNLANQLKVEINSLIENRKLELAQKEKAAQWETEKIDVTLPGSMPLIGQNHPLTLVMEEIKEIFLGMGFTIAHGPEIETDFYNFEALNMPKEHPARDMQDSFYISEEIVLRTHTSPVQIRTMEKVAPEVPLRIIAPGRVYRRDDDATHSPMFHQVEGLAVDKDISMGDLKGTLLLFARQMFGKELKIRLRPSFFPFTEPSAEVDISCVICQGKGCRVCSHSGWLEVLGAGMIHPKVLEISGYDPEEVTGYAFGMGVERIAMLKYGFDDLRLFFSNDLRMLRQF
ncbi:phenylalanine--tRNA ligase subunit alpha [Candidatus Contubernalis alkalaceticus]|uniref:phenylalanine--tRNA ligase subunit alpha n=1 Tax=Candidatus Contubernalis alkaliaceticus TaxID=338645 RepID=UPI002A4E1D64|nr:phenylalanine--tRNA ligase subunit alpha [Candidatus Contubernalis alkalaceticus]UNC92645.1 phenylalanine--tRNA ligase subunit alpha [Candidatus Contubernalis alkalaceticus]